MRILFTCLLAAMIFRTAAAADTGHVFKVLPLWLDQQGRTATSPSLFDRDAYQVVLRDHADQVSALRYDILWTAKKSSASKYVLRLELRSVAADGKPKLKTFETSVTPGFFRKWNSFTLTGDEMKKFGSVVAWRATLWDGATAVGEQKSFLW